jgi:hypothetical protein
VWVALHSTIRPLSAIARALDAPMAAIFEASNAKDGGALHERRFSQG